MPSTETEAQVQAYYNSSTQMYETLIGALEAAGMDLNTLTPRDLAPVDQFHSGGWPATLGLAKTAGITGEDYVLDVGGGIGGPARCIASEIGCTVEVIDLTSEFVRTGEKLTELLNLSNKVHFQLGGALEMPYPDAHFDVVVTQHSSMNMPDKPTLYREIARVLKPGGTLAIHEFMAGNMDDMIFPVPWASRPEMSSLETPETIRTILHDSGFQERVWRDVSEEAIAGFAAQAANAPAQPSPLGLHILIPNIGLAIKNLVANLKAKRVYLIQAVLQRT